MSWSTSLAALFSHLLAHIMKNQYISKFKVRHSYYVKELVKAILIFAIRSSFKCNSMNREEQPKLDFLSSVSWVVCLYFILKEWVLKIRHNIQTQYSWIYHFVHELGVSPLETVSFAFLIHKHQSFYTLVKVIPDVLFDSGIHLLQSIFLASQLPRILAFIVLAQLVKQYHLTYGQSRNANNLATRAR